MTPELRDHLALVGLPSPQTDPDLAREAADLLLALAEAPEDAPTLGDQLTAEQISQFIGITNLAIHKMARDGHIPRLPNKRFELVPTIRAYIGYLRGEDVARKQKIAHLELTEARAQRERTLEAKSRGELVEIESVQRKWTGQLRAFRAAILAVPNRIGETLRHLKPADVDEIDREIRETLSALADGGEST